MKQKKVLFFVCFCLAVSVEQTKKNMENKIQKYLLSLAVELSIGAATRLRILWQSEKKRKVYKSKMAAIID